MGRIISQTLGRGNSAGDSGTFCSQKTMNAIKKAQTMRANKPAFTKKGNAMTKGMLTGSYKGTN